MAPVISFFSFSATLRKDLPPVIWPNNAPISGWPPRGAAAGATRIVDDAGGGGGGGGAAAPKVPGII